MVPDQLNVKETTDKKKWQQYTKAIVIVFTIFGLVLSFYESDRVISGGNLPWVRIPLPNGHHAAEFQLGESNELLVMSVQGQVFARVWKDGESGWQDVGAVEESILICNKTSLDDLEIRDPPFVFQSINCDFSIYPEASTDTRFVILRICQEITLHFRNQY